jgi:hypothetical protein
VRPRSAVVARLVVACAACAACAACQGEGPPPSAPASKSAGTGGPGPIDCDGGTPLAAGCLVGTRRSYHDAEKDCARRRGRLAVVDDAQKSRAIAGALVSPWGYGSGLWLGCTDSEKEGEWQCGGRPMSFTRWAPGQPDNALALDDCLEWLADVAAWNDMACDTKLGWLCRGDASLPCSGAGTKRVVLGAATFCAHGGETRDWSSAKSACEKDGGKLAVIDGDAEDRALAEALRLPSRVPSWQPLEGVWIGLTDEATEGSFVWATGARLGWSNWLPAQPDDSGTGEDCVTLTLGDGRWNDADCGKPLPYLCQ